MSDDKLIKTDDPNLLKYSDTGALVSTNVSAFKKFKLKEEQSKKIKNQENDLNNIRCEVSELKNEIGEIKDLLYQLLNK